MSNRVGLWGTLRVVWHPTPELLLSLAHLNMCQSPHPTHHLTYVRSPHNTPYTVGYQLNIPYDVSLHSTPHTVCLSHYTTHTVGLPTQHTTLCRSPHSTRHTVGLATLHTALCRSPHSTPHTVDLPTLYVHYTGLLSQNTTHYRSPTQHTMYAHVLFVPTEGFHHIEH